MSINYASKYSPKVDERFYKEAVSTPAINQNYDWVGVDTVKVYSIPTVPMGDYQTSGTSRYGTPDELGNSVQTMLLTKDRAFTFTIDRKSADDTVMTMEAGKALARQINEVSIPEVDGYRLFKMATNAGNYDTTSLSKNNAYETALSMQAYLDNANVPQVGRVFFVTPKAYNFIKLDSSFIKSGDLSQTMLLKGQVGEIDGVPVIKVPESRMPVGCSILLTHNSATVAPVKLETYKIHQDAPGINGWLVEGRIRYDAFVLNMKKEAICANVLATTTNTCTFASNGATGGTLPSAITGFTGGKFKAPSANLVKSDKAFLKWNDGTNDILPGAEVTLSSDITLTAVYEA